MIIELHDPITQIEQECADGALGRRSIALTFAFAIKQIDPADRESWRRANEAVVKRFGEKGRDWIKARAWKYVEGKITPGARGDTK